MFRRLATASAVTLVTAASVVFATPQASASVAECSNGANGFADIPYNLSGTIIRSVDLGRGARAELHAGNVGGVRRGWARISGSTAAGDKVWMDWSTTSGNGWLQCGPFTVQNNGAPNTSAAQVVRPDLSSWVFRACGVIVGGSGKCTGWW